MSDAFEHCTRDQLLFTKAALIIFKAIHDIRLLFSLFNMVNVFVFISGNKAKSERDRETEKGRERERERGKMYYPP